MKKLICGFIAGFLLASVLAIPIVKMAMNDKYHFGYGQGVLTGESEVIRFLGKHFEVTRPPDGCKDSLITKPGGIYITERNGKAEIEVTKW
ncbi:MAG: hypothetical protein WCS52_09055 [bacterium]